MGNNDEGDKIKQIHGYIDGAFQISNTLNMKFHDIYGRKFEDGSSVDKVIMDGLFEEVLC